MVVFESIARLLLFVHFIAAVCVAALVVHLAVRVFGYVGGRVVKVAQEKLYATLLLIFYVVNFIVAAMLYPTFRVRVRHEHFDRDLRWATGLFEVKEHFAAIGLVLVIGLWLLSRATGRLADAPQRRIVPAYAAMVAMLLIIVAYNVWSGWYLTTLRSV